MRTTLNIDVDLLQRVQQLTGVTEKTAIAKPGLEALIARESARRLAKLAGTDPDLKEVPRQRFAQGMFCSTPLSASGILGNPAVRLLNDELVVSHEYVVAELACGSLKSREDTIGYLNALATQGVGAKPLPRNSRF